MNHKSSQKTRRLKVVRIDDRAQSPVSQDKYFPVQGDGVVSYPLELVTYKVKGKIGIAINSLENARAFWLEFVPASSPDIVIGDVDFELDNSTPLKSWDSNATHIPSGLMHCKPFVAIARAASRPISVVIHTADPNKWLTMERALSQPEDRNRIFMLLAAHEAMEIAAILGHVIPNANRENLRPVWQWLQEHTQTSPGAALETALMDYRKQVIYALRSGNDARQVRLRVDFGEWRQLLAWCQRMQKEPKPLSGDTDIGLPLLYPDGRTDRISLASLFADVRGLSNIALDGSCFKSVKVREPWSLAKGLPQIGALIAECGELGEVSDKAETALKELPFINEQLKVNLRKAAGGNPLAMGLAVLFRALEIYRSDETRWEQIWKEGHWHPGRRTEVDDAKDYSWARPLSQWVQLAATALREVAARATEREEFVDLDTAAEKFKELAPSNVRGDLIPESIRWHLDILCELGIAESRIDSEGQPVYCVRRDRRDADELQLPQRPMESGMGFNWLSDSLPLALRDSLGFGVYGPGEVNDNAIGQILHDAFAGEDLILNANDRAKSGRDFLETFRNGNAPGWIQETCRTYCQEALRWTDIPRWPKSIASR
jgi:hypothetical protein